MTTRTRSRRVQVKPPVEDIEQSPVKPSKKSATKEQKSKKQSPKNVVVAQQKSKTAQKVSPSKKTPDSGVAASVTSKKGKKAKKDTHAFSSYFERKRGTVQYSYHVSPAAQVFVASPSPKQQTKSEDRGKKVQKKRKADATVVFDYCSEDEEVVLPVPAKKAKITTDNVETKKKSPARKRNITSPNSKVVKKPKIEKSTKSPVSSMKEKTAAKTSRSPRKRNSGQKEEIVSPAKKKGERKKVAAKPAKKVTRKAPKATASRSRKKPTKAGKVARKKPQEDQQVEGKDQTVSEEVMNELVSTEEETCLDTTQSTVEESEESQPRDSQGSVTEEQGELTGETSLQSEGNPPEDRKAQETPEEPQDTGELTEDISADDTTELEEEIEEHKEEIDKHQEEIEEHKEEIDKHQEEIEEHKEEIDKHQEDDAGVNQKVTPDVEVVLVEENNEVVDLTEVQIPAQADTVHNRSSSLDVKSTYQQSLEPSADLSLTETEDTFARKSFDHHLKDTQPSVPSLTRSSTWPKSSVSTTFSVSAQPAQTQPRTMVRNVRQAHECLQHGENVQFRDQVEYLIDNMRPTQPLSVRCLSTLSLATECLKPDFCRQLRAHGLVYKLMMLLKDAVEHPSLQVAAVALFFVVSYDRIDGTDLDRNCLELLLGLMEKSYDEDENNCTLDDKAMKEFRKIKAKSQLVLEKCPPLAVREKERMAKEDSENVIDTTRPDHTEGLQPSTLSIRGLMCEFFYNITSTQSNCHWIKEEMRILGILDVIANRAIQLIEQIGEKSLSGQVLFLKVIRIMKLLENTTFMNKGNQTYLTVFDGSLLISRLCSCLVSLKGQVVDNCENRYLCLEGLLGILRVLLNLTHDHELGSFRVGEQSDILECVLECIFKIPESSTGDRTFDLLILSLGLLINLVEHSAPNRQLLFDSHVSVTRDEKETLVLASQAITELFLLNYKKSEETTIDVPTPQNLSQRTPASSPLKASFSSSVVKKDTSVPLASRLKIHKDIKGYRSPAKLRGPEPASTEGDGMDWLPTGDDEGSDHEEDEEEEEEEPVTDSLVFSREDFDTALTQAGKHMEDSIVSSYTALLLAVLAKHSVEFADSLKRQLPSSNYSSLISILKEFIEFMGMAGSSTTRSGLDSIRKIVKHLETLEEQTVV